jgi:pimeloyl-ACP methyl ester carboxylesterase
VRKLLLNDVGPRITAQSMERIGVSGSAGAFKTFEEGLAYLQTISASFGRHTPEQWRELNGAILKPVQGAEGLEWGCTIRRWPCRSRKRRRRRCRLAKRCMGDVRGRQGPTLIVRGAQSDLLLRETVAEMVARGKQVSTVEIPDVGHAPTFVDPAQIAIARNFSWD